VLEDEVIDGESPHEGELDADSPMLQEAEPLFTGVRESRDPDTDALLQETTFKDGVQDGESRIYNADGIVVQKLNYANGVLDGTTKNYDAKGGLLQEMPYVAGELEGLALFFMNDTKIAEIPYVGGKRQGKAIFYTQTGIKISEMEYKEDKQNGEHVLYDSQTQAVLRREFYADDLLTGIATTYYPSGSVMLEETLVQGKKDGPTIKYTEDGSSREITYFKDNAIVEDIPAAVVNGS
jgi:antitoxin component YwqK of YwqJK toxin-antitoxin module